MIDDRNLCLQQNPKFVSICRNPSPAICGRCANLADISNGTMWLTVELNQQVDIYTLHGLIHIVELEMIQI